MIIRNAGGEYECDIVLNEVSTRFMTLWPKIKVGQTRALVHKYGNVMITYGCHLHHGIMTSLPLYFGLEGG